ncbi:hypothetical protein [Candidatus Palauibacter sp.]|uniref:hypothetical protein n=1 Tax=Candidatus Palauibacter sp. TaxID=3101350 RepID=UPI003B01EB70
MNTFAVMIREPEARTLESLNDQYEPDNVYQINSTTFLVRTKQLAEAVSVAAGIKGEDRFASGVVFKLNRSYAGYTARSLWEWLQEGEE